MSKGDAGRELLILGVLRREPLSAYSITKTVKMHGPLYRTLARGNVYEQLEQLRKSGLVTMSEERASRGPRATKHVYAITVRGRRRFDALMSACFSDALAPDATLEVACVLLTDLPRERARALLRKRLDALGAQRKRLERLYGSRDARSPGRALATSHADQRIQSEILWTKSAIRSLKDRSV